MFIFLLSRSGPPLPQPYIAPNHIPYIIHTRCSPFSTMWLPPRMQTRNQVKPIVLVTESIRNPANVLRTCKHRASSREHVSGRAPTTGPPLGHPSWSWPCEGHVMAAWSSTFGTHVVANYTIYNIQYTIYNIQYTIYNIQYTIYNIQYIIYNI